MTTRGEFLAGTAAAASQIAAASPPPKAAPSASPSPEPSFPPLHFDAASFDAVLDVPAAHKHLFASAKINGGLVLDSMRGTLNAYRDLGVSGKDVQPVAVFYHGSSFLGFDDEVWNAFFIPLQPKGEKNLNEFAKDLATVYDGKRAGNPCLHKKKDDDATIESLSAAGARFFVCNNAAKGLAGYAASHLKLDPLRVYATMTAHLVPNAMLVPAGVWAIHAVQERRYTYMQATL
jgi:intracellular sulfur oxidation DsrE/DsrF family protein